MNRKRSVRGKLTSIIMWTCATAVLLACLGFVLQDIVDERDDLKETLGAFGEVIAANSSAALTFGDHKSAEEVLAVLRTKPSFIAGCIYTDRGQPFATYDSGTHAALPSHLSMAAETLVQRDGRVEFFRPITLDGERVGTLYIASDLRELRARMKEDIQFTSIVLLVCLIVAFVLSSRLQRRISEPIIELANIANLISQHKNFSVRATHTALHDNDEIGNLMTGFNSMLAGLEQRDQKLVLYQSELETTVAQRTAELTTANEELLVAKNTAEKIAAINAQLARESALILNSATDGILGLGLDGRPTFLNPAASNMFGRSLEGFARSTFHDLAHHSYPDGTPWPRADCPLSKAVRCGEPVSMAGGTFWRSDGSSFPVEYSVTPMFNEDGNLQGGVMTFRDVTERRAIEKLKGEFVSTVSHELRTPLTSIRGALGLLSSGLLGPIAEKGQRMLEIAVTNTDRLVRLINDILDLERIESGKVELTRGAVDAQTVMDQAREGLQSMADQAHVRIVAEPLAGSLWGDSDRIIQTLTNLIGNAIKFSPRDTTVTLSGTAGATEFTFCVADQGRGVPDDKLDSIFQRFNQVDASDSRNRGGSGLGLAISQSIVTAHGGRIWAEKNEPAGTRLQFTIPLALRPAISTPAVEPQTVASAVAGPSVLIVEDDTDLARVMATALQRRGLRTHQTASGAEAIQLCRQHEPSLIVLDLGLHDLDGFAVVDSLRRSPLLRNVTLLVYSASDIGSDDQSRLRLGRTEFLTKSRCSFADFEAHVVRLLESAATTKDSQYAA
jgi:PAS domain S-box-containing protein